jgi:hypothetical protein
MSVCNVNPITKIIHTQYGTLNIWGTQRWSSKEWGDSVEVEFPEDEGGLTLPDGKVYYSVGSLRWNTSNGFLSEVKSVRGDVDIRSQITKSKQRILRFNDPEVLLISDLLFDLLHAGELPIAFIDSSYHLKTQQVMHEWYAKFTAIQERETELNEFAKTEGRALDKFIHPDSKYSYNPFPMYRQTRF